VATVPRKRSTIGAKIRAERLRRDLTQERAAALLGVDRVTLARWETEARAPRGLYAKAVERFLAGR
jgi:transcriptional regulator with XRE-family HTH domain